MRPTAFEHTKLASFSAIVVREEVLDLVEETGRKVIQRPSPGVDLWRLGSADQAVVSNPVTSLCLLRLEDTEQSHRNHAPRERRLSLHDHHVDGITVCCPGAGNEAEVEWKYRSGGKSLVQPEQAEMIIELELVPAARGGVHHHVHEARGGYARRESHPVRRPIVVHDSPSRNLAHA